MKTAKEWAEKLKAALGPSLKADPMLPGGNSMIEVFIRSIQLDAVGETENKPPVLAGMIDSKG